MKFCCNVLKGTWWFYGYTQPQINFCPYCGEKLKFELLADIQNKMKEKETEKK